MYILNNPLCVASVPRQHRAAEEAARGGDGADRQDTGDKQGPDGAGAPGETQAEEKQEDENGSRGGVREERGRYRD